MTVSASGTLPQRAKPSIIPDILLEFIIISQVSSSPTTTDDAESIDRFRGSPYGLKGMGRHFFTFSILCMAWLSAPLRAQDVPGQYIWPIHGYTNLSAGFCDFRTRHYHGGIDLSTNGQEGLPVQAADSGWVGRVSIGYWGYGKAVYLQLADGRMAVYGHLSELSEKIQKYVEDEQYKSKRYKQDLFPATRLLPIARGEVIGKSGQTGAGPPHLHFEIRTGDNKPLNPLAFYEKRDAIKPLLYTVIVTPIQPDDLDTPPSTVDGSLLPKSFSVQKGTLATSPHVTGTVGISVLADDHIDAPRWTMSAYRHRLIVNEMIIGEVRYDSINYDDTRQIEIERHYDPDGGLSPRAVRLYRRERNSLWHYHGFARDGLLSVPTSLASGKNQIRIEIEDFAGNKSAIAFTLVVDSLPSRGPLASDSKSLTGTLTWGGSVLSVVSAKPAPPDVATDPEGQKVIRHWVRGRDGWQAWLPAAGDADVLWVRSKPGATRTPAPLGWKPVSSYDGGLVTSEDGQATVTFAAGDLYVSGAYTLRSGEGNAAGALTPLYTLGPRLIPFARDAQLSMAIPKTKIAPEKLGIYRNRKGSWSLEGRAREKGWAALRATIKNAGSFAILADQKSPVIANVTPGKGVAVSGRRPTIRFEVSDNLSGIGSDEDLQLTIDDQWVPVEFDPDLRQAKARPRWELEPGDHSVVIVARDVCGNESRLVRTLTVRR